MGLFGRTKIASLCALLFVACGDDNGSSGPDSQCEGAKCDNAEDDDEDGPARACSELIEDFSGSGLSVDDIRGNTDPVAQLVLAPNPERCPMSVADLVEALARSGCSDHGTQFVSERSQLLGVFTDYRAVTDFTCAEDQRVFLHFPVLATDVKDIEITENGPRLGQNINEERLRTKLDHTFPAIISEDARGTFNYYQSSSRVHRVCMPAGAGLTADAFSDDLQACATTAECGEGEECLQRPDELGVEANFRFFGNSMDYVNNPNRQALLEAMAQALPGPVTTEADIDHSLDVERNCGACHPNGGITMRELESPWVHWDAASHFSSPQTRELVGAAPDILGGERDGLDFESTVKTANLDYIGARIDASLQIIASEEPGSRTFTTGDLLRPLFCTDEFNLLTTGSHPGVDLTAMPIRNAVVDGRISPFDSIPTNHADFLTRIAAPDRDWRLWGFSAGPFAALLAQLGVDPPRETLGTLTFIERANIDEVYETQLFSRGIINNEFIFDVLSIDFTRAVFSEERCALLSVVDRVDPGVFIDAGAPREGAPQLLRDAVIGVLQPEPGPQSGAEADFLANLVETGTDPRPRVQQFINVCKARPGGEMLDDYLTYLAQVPKRAAHQATAMSLGEAAFLMFRFPGANGFMMPEAMGQSFQPGLRFDPDTCALIDHYPGE